MATSTNTTSPAGSPVTGAPDPGNVPVSSGMKVLTDDELKALKGSNTGVRNAEGEITDEVPPGTLGYIDLDETGRPTGTIHKAMNPEGAQAPVMNIAPITAAELTTPAGAPITDKMNPAPTHYDQGLMERNPPNATPKYDPSKITSDTSAVTGVAPAKTTTTTTKPATTTTSTT